MPEDPETGRAFSLVHGQVCYLQLPAADRNRAAAFYQAVFGWPATRRRSRCNQGFSFGRNTRRKDPGLLRCYSVIL